MQEKIHHEAVGEEGRLYIPPTDLLRGEPALPSSKYYTLRYLLAATLAKGESSVAFTASSDDSEALIRSCRALGAVLTWDDTRQDVSSVRCSGLLYNADPVTNSVGNN